MNSFRISTTLLLAATCFLMMSVVSTESVTTCDGSIVQRLSCASGVISVESALYGRKDSMLCSSGRPANQLTNTDCALENTVNILKRRCDGKTECEYTPSLVRTSDPCPGIYKYLQTNYTCLPALTMTLCEHSYGELFCDAGQEIFVLGADYGRRDRTTCAYKRPTSQIQLVTCVHPAPEVAERCNGKNRCLIKASNSVFGDPCGGTFKYLEVAYTCFYPSVSSDNESTEHYEEI